MDVSKRFSPSRWLASVLAQYWLNRYAHRRLAWLSHAIGVGVFAHTVENNYGWILARW